MANQYDTNLKLQAIADAIGDSSSSGLIQALEDIADAVAGGGGGGSSTAGLVSDNFSETDTYDLGDYCIHNNTLYVCINAITTPGPWDLSDWQATNAGLELTSLNSALAEISDTEYAVTFNSNYFSSIQTKVVKIGKSLHINAVLLCSTVPPADPSVIGAIVKGANLAPLSKNYAAIVTAMRSTNDVYMYLKTDGNLTVLSAYNFSASTWYTFDVIVDLA